MKDTGTTVTLEVGEEVSRLEPALVAITSTVSSGVSASVPLTEFNALDPGVLFIEGPLDSGSIVVSDPESVGIWTQLLEFISNLL